MELTDAVRPPSLRRTWLFVPGNDINQHAIAMKSGADAIVADLEEMTAPEDRVQAQQRIVAMLRETAVLGKIGAVRINKLEHDGHTDLQGIMAGAPRAIFLPHSENATQMIALDAALFALETVHGITPGSTEIVPTIESAKGLVALADILSATSRIRCCMLAVEDLAANLGARRTPGATELLYARSRFLIECVAAECVAIDLPCTYRSDEILAADLDLSTQLGFTSKCVVFAEHVPEVNNALTPSPEAISEALERVAAYAIQDVGMNGKHWIDAPERNNAARLIARHKALAAFG
ncbi:HpcH/HpaI aldolase/citrate lyase family protein [Caballeronia sp. KNU42]